MLQAVLSNCDRRLTDENKIDHAIVHHESTVDIYAIIAISGTGMTITIVIHKAQERERKIVLC